MPLQSQTMTIGKHKLIFSSVPSTIGHHLRRQEVPMRDPKKLEKDQGAEISKIKVHHFTGSRASLLCKWENGAEIQILPWKIIQVCRVEDPLTSKKVQSTNIMIHFPNKITNTEIQVKKKFGQRGDVIVQASKIPIIMTEVPTPIIRFQLETGAKKEVLKEIQVWVM